PPEFDTNAEPKVIQPAQINVSPALAEVIRLAQSGTDESVVIAYVQKAPPYQVTGDEIIYLRDLGISDTIVKSLIEHQQPTANPPATPPTVAVPAAPANPPAPTGPPGAAAPVGPPP